MKNDERTSGIFYGLSCAETKLTTIKRRNQPNPTGFKLGMPGEGKAFRSCPNCGKGIAQTDIHDKNLYICPHCKKEIQLI